MADLISIEEARGRVLSAVRPLPPESIQVGEALDRVLAADVISLVDVPPFSSSAMDGYAIGASSSGQALAVIGESRAGTPSDRPLEEGTAIRISTGAQVPPGAAAVVRQEDVDRRDGTIVLRCDVKPGENLRPAGEVMHAGKKVLARGLRLGPAELGMAVAAGAAHLQVSARPRVTVLCTGDELRDPGEQLRPGDIYNSNAPMLAALAARAGAAAPASPGDKGAAAPSALGHPAAAPPYAGRLPDDRRATEIGLEEALRFADVLVISGGVSVGPHDHVKPALAALGVGELFWGVALQPGKPTWFGARQDKLVFGLPGNPVSAAVTFSLFVAPALAALQGAAAPLPVRRQALLGGHVRRNPAREQALRVILEQRDDGLIAVPNGPQGSHQITSLVGAEALALIPAGEGVMEAGTPVAAELLAR
jgi:molybdopterin molybdotransferase